MDNEDIKKISLKSNEYLICRFDPYRWNFADIRKFLKAMPKGLKKRSIFYVGEIEFTKIKKSNKEA